MTGPWTRDDASGRLVYESSIIIEYLEQHYPGRTQLLPADADLASETQLQTKTRYVST